MSHSNAPLSVEGRRRLIARCEHRPIAHMAAEMGISRTCASKWVHRYRQFGELALADRPSKPHQQPTATSGAVVARIEDMRRRHKWSASRIALELASMLAYLREGETYTDLAIGFGIGVTTVFRYIREALDVLAAMTTILSQAVEAARRKAFVIIDGTLLRTTELA